jgi:integrase
VAAHDVGTVQHRDARAQVNVGGREGDLECGGHLEADEARRAGGPMPTHDLERGHGARVALERPRPAPAALEAGTLRLDPGTTKNDEPRIVYLTAELVALLTAQVQRIERLGRRLGQIPRFLFPHLDGRHQGQPRHDFRKRWASACRRAGVPGRLVHDLRRTAVRNMVRQGVPERVAMQLSGHKTRSVFERYNIVSDGDLREAARRLASPR